MPTALRPRAASPPRYHAALMASDELAPSFFAHWSELRDADANEFVFARLDGVDEDVFLEDS